MFRRSSGVNNFNRLPNIFEGLVRRCCALLWTEIFQNLGAPPLSHTGFGSSQICWHLSMKYLSHPALGDQVLANAGPLSGYSKLSGIYNEVQLLA